MDNIHSKITSISNTTGTFDIPYSNNTVPNTTVLWSDKDTSALFIYGAIGAIGGCILPLAIPCLCNQKPTGAIYNFDEGIVDTRAMMARDRAHEERANNMKTCWKTVDKKKLCIGGAIVGFAVAAYAVFSQSGSDDSSSSKNAKSTFLDTDNAIELNATELSSITSDYA